MVVVVFKDSREDLVNFFASTFKSVKEAKRHMEADAYAYAYAYASTHGGIPKWVSPKSEDYLEVEGTDGCNCIWQYCNMSR